MRPLTARLDDVYCSITVSNYGLIRLVRLSRQTALIYEKVLQIDFILYFMHTKFLREIYLKNLPNMAMSWLARPGHSLQTDE